MEKCVRFAPGPREASGHLRGFAAPHVKHWTSIMERPFPG